MKYLNTKLNLNRKLLIKLYWHNLKNSIQIAKYCKCTHRTIFNYMIKYNIRIRTRSEALKLSKHNKGNNNVSKRADVRNKISLSLLGKPRKDMLGNKNPAKRTAVRKKISKALKNRKINWKDKISRTIIKNEICKGKNNGMWKNGISKLPYSFNFTKELKEQIRKRDNYICKNCRITEEEHLIIYNQVLSVHHIDYNKLNCKENNLITTCRNCNTRANHNRDYWYTYYKYLMENYYEQKMGMERG